MEIVAERFNTPGSVPAVTVSYFVTDHLGSVSLIADSLGVVSERDAYDAWGKRRDASTWADDPPCLLTSTTTRGYAGHEEMDSVCLINANARLYDPTIGRFMSADDVTQNVYVRFPDPNAANVTITAKGKSQVNVAGTT